MATQKVRVRLRGYDVELLDKAAKAIINAVKSTGAKYSGPVPLPTEVNKFTVLRSVHVNIKSREQFEMRTHKRLIDIEPNEDTLDAMMKIELAAGVDVDIKQN